MTVRLPVARGPLSNFVVEHLRRPVHKLPGLLAPTDSPLGGEDFHLALYCCYRLLGPSFSDVDGAWEWSPTLIEFREGLENQFLAAVTMGGDDATLGDTALIVHSAGSDDRLHQPAERLAHAGSEDEVARALARRALMAETQAVVSHWVLRRFPAGNLQALVFAKAARKTFSEFTDAGIEADLADVPGAELARANLLNVLGLRREYDASLNGALAVVGSIDHRSDRALAEAAGRCGSPEQQEALERSAARAIDSLPLDIFDRPRAAARAAAGAQWMLAASARAAGSIPVARTAARPLSGLPYSTPRSSPA